MIIDIIFIVLLAIAIFKGYSRGLIVAVFSFLAIIIGLAAAMKLSTVVADHLGRAVKISDKWLPFISFAIVFIGVVLLVRLGANALQKATETLLLGWVNRLGGILFYAAIYLTAYSVLLFYANQMKLFSQETIHASVTYSFIEPWGPKAINTLGDILPFFKDMFHKLEDFFSKMARNL